MILHLTQSLNPTQSGIARCVLDLHRESLRQGQDSRCLGFGAPDSCQEQGVELFSQEFLPAAFYSAGFRRRVHELAPKIKSLHVHGLWVYPNLLAGQTARTYGVPLVIHPHGMLEPWALNRSRLKKRLVRFFFEDHNFRNATAWRALTLAEADQIRQLVPRAEIRIIPNGIDLNPIEKHVEREVVEHRWPELGGKKIILFLGRLHVKKGLDLLIQSWKRLSPQFPQWHLVIAGPDDGFRGPLITLIENENLGHRVTLAGPVKGEMKTALFQHCDIFVLPSHSEGFSVAVLEAMAASRPVLVTTGCHLEEVVVEKCGMVCEAEADSWTRAMHAFLTTTDQNRSEMGARGGHLVRKRFLWPAITEQFIEFTKTMNRTEIGQSKP
ncbi:MAG: glycosyltransferase [Verrucomicrobiae bacterium]|nr:glycosyltransferase [Verrucomicrobiae bacterium]